MSVTGFGGATIWTEDINRLLPFYRDTIGLVPGVTRVPEGSGGPDFVVFGDQTSPALSIGTHSDVHGPNRDPARHMVGLLVEGIESEVARLRAVGVPFVDDVTDFGGLKIATLTDPDGNYVQLFEFSRREP